MPSSSKFFQKGYGDLNKFEAVFSEVQSRGLLNPDSPPPAPHVQWSGPPERHGQITVRPGSFPSPLQEHLPPTSQAATFELVQPVPQDKPPADDDLPLPASRVAIHFPTTGDQWYWYRRRVAKQLAQRGVSSLILMFPLYGERRPKSQRMHLVETVADLATATVAASLEGAALCSWVARTFPDAQCCFTGTSMGGALATCAAVAAGRPVSCCPANSPMSAAALVLGVMRGRVDWAALKGGSARLQSEEEGKLASVLETISLARVLNHAKRKPQLRSVVQIVAQDDKFISQDQSEQLHRALADIVPSHRQVKLVKAGGGHVWGIFFLWDSVYCPAILECMDMFDQASVTTEISQ